MPTPILATKLYIPPLQANVVSRPHLLKRLNEGLYQERHFSRKLTLISAPAGFGKTTLVGEWVNQKDGNGRMRNEKRDIHPSSFIPHPTKVAWLSLDEGDNDPTRFLAYFVAALQTVVPTLGEGIVAALQSPQPPPIESILTTLLNEITAVSDPFLLILDDYHLIDAPPIDNILTFLLKHLPPQMHLVITTREDPQIPLARYRARDQLNELRANDLRFTSNEAATFLNQMMNLNLSAANIAALETRTEGWIAGLQLAALALRGHLAARGQPPMQEQPDATNFIQSFTGSHRFVLDYLLEEVLHQQPESIQTFLLQTSILDRLCAPLCDAVVGKLEIRDWRLKSDHQETLAYLEQANLFIIPLDNERRWYRYHHLFADLLRQRLQQQTLISSTRDGEQDVAELHSRASVWYEDNGLEIEAFHHATAANDIEHAVRLVEGKGMPLHFRGAADPVLSWLESLPTTVLDANPSLWVMYASALLFVSQVRGVERKLQAAEAALQSVEPDDKTRDLIGHIAAIRATLAITQNQVETIFTQSHRALEYLHPDNLPVRTSVTWALGYAYELQGDRAAASQAYSDSLAISQAIGHTIIEIMAALGLGGIQEVENQLYLAAESYHNVLKQTGDPPLPVACAAYLGLARLAYEWNDLDTAVQYGQQSLPLAQQLGANIDREVTSELFLARLKLAQGDVAGATALLTKIEQAARQHHFVQQLLEITAVQVQILLQQNNLTAAAQLAEAHDLPMSQARVYLAQANPAKALTLLKSLRQQVEAKHWQDEQLRVMVLQAVAYDMDEDWETAVQILGEALALAELGGFIRLFVDEGLPMEALLTKIKDNHNSEYIHKLMAAFGQNENVQPSSPNPQTLVEPLSQRELEVLQLVAQGLSNREIGERLFLALDTVKGHNRRIYGKLHVQRRTEAVAYARKLGLL